MLFNLLFGRILLGVILLNHLVSQIILFLFDPLLFSQLLLNVHLFHHVLLFHFPLQVHHLLLLHQVLFHLLLRFIPLQIHLVKHFLSLSYYILWLRNIHPKTRTLLWTQTQIFNQTVQRVHRTLVLRLLCVAGSSCHYFSKCHFYNI